VLWDCISLVDEETVVRVRELGGIDAIAISHPHYYSAMVEWSRAFGDAPIYLHARDREHVVHPDPAIVYWEGDRRPIGRGLTLICCGGHFDGGTVLHWEAGAGGRGALLSGDIVQVVADRRYVSFMYSYPNLIPLSEEKVRGVAAALDPYDFEKIYGAWWDRVVEEGGKASVRRSAERYIAAIS
jgi:glyoxylase-like metal-dependent hydrolase (beta-lactamase superfamily II)